MRPKCLKFLQGFGDDVAEPHLLRRKINTPERSDLNEMRRPTLLQAATTVRWWSFQSHVVSHLLKYQQLRGKRGEQPDREPCLSKIVVNLLGQKELMSRELRGHFNFVLGCDLTNDAVVCNDLF